MAPLVFNKGFSLSLLCQMGILIIFALSYNMLLGQTGLLSFGHAVYYGLGALFSIHALNLVQAGWKFPVTLMPLVGGVAGLVFGVIFGYVTTRRAGTTFAMISLGIGEMVAALLAHVSRVLRRRGGRLGQSLGRAARSSASLMGRRSRCTTWSRRGCCVATAAMYALSRTPLGRMANAVRDNPERAQFVGYDPQHVRFMMVALSGFFAGVAGGLAALNYEIVTAESLSASTSGMVLLATYLGGIGFFAGPVAGAIVVTLMETALGSVTKAWPFYFGAMFLATVLFVPGGLASVAMLHKRLWDAKLMKSAAVVYAIMAIPSALAVGFAVLLVEMAYNASDESRSPFNVLGVALDTTATGAWIGALALTVAAFAAWRFTWRFASPRWAELGASLAGDRRT